MEASRNSATARGELSRRRQFRPSWCGCDPSAEFEAVQRAVSQTTKQKMSTETITPEIVTDEVALVVKESGVAQDSALTLHGSFQPLLAKARDILAQSKTIVVTDASQTLQIKLSREARLALRSVRVESDKTRKALKEDSLRRSRAIDGFHNILLHIVEQEEKRLDDQEKIVERMEAARKEKLKTEREDALRPYGVDTTFYQLAEMPEQSFAQLLENSRLSHEAKQAAARKAEEERIAREKAEREEQERIRAENERLKREALEAAKREEEERNKRAQAEAKAKAERDAAEKAERERLAAERAAAQKKLAEEKAKADEALRVEREKARIEREAAEAKAMAERQAIEAAARLAKDEADRKARAEREAREKIEAELRAKQEKERKLAEAKAKAERAAAMAPDSEKIVAYARTIRTAPRPQVTTKEASALVAQINEQCEKFAAWLEKKAAELKGGAS